MHYIDEARNGNLIIGAAGNLKRGRRPNNPPALVTERPAKRELNIDSLFTLIYTLKIIKCL